MFKATHKGSKSTVAMLFTLLLVAMFTVQCGGQAATPAPQPTVPAAMQPVKTEPTNASAPTDNPAAPAQAQPATSGDVFGEGCWQFPTSPVTIEVWWHEYAPFTAYMKELIDRYQTLHPNVKINSVVASQSDLNQKLSVAMASGTGPDILDQDISVFAAYYDKKVLEPIDTSVFCAKSQADIEAQYVKSVLPGVTFDGKIYGLPYQTNSMSLFISTDAFKEIGLDAVKDAPKTWDDLKKIGAQLKKVDNGKTVRKGYDFPYFSQRWMLLDFQPMVQQFGGSLLSEDQTKCQLNSEPAVKALTLWNDVTTSIGDPSFTLNTAAQNSQDFIDGRTAMWVTGPWATQQLMDSQIKDRWAVTSLPQVDPGNPKTVMYGFAWGVNKTKPDLNKKVAWDFIRFTLAKPEEWLAKASFIQPRTGLLDKPSVKAFPFIAVHLKDIETATWLLSNPKTNEITQIVGKAIERTVMQGTDPKASLDQAEDECTKALSAK